MTAGAGSTSITTRLTLLALIGAMLVGSAPGVHGAEVLFDFEDESQLACWKVWSPDRTDVILSPEWATDGARSLRIEAEAYVEGEMPPQYYPGVSTGAGGTGLRTRDWRQYAYLTVDVKVLQDSTPLGVLVQRSGSRLDRVSPTFTLAAGEYRLWLDLPDLIGGGANEAAKLASIASLEFHMTRTPQRSVIFIDRICLVGGFAASRERERREDIGVRTLAELARNKHWLDADSDVLEYVENLAPSTAVLLREKAGTLGALRRAVGNAQADAERDAVLVQDAAPTAFAVFCVPVDERVFFSHQAIEPHWEQAVELHLLRGETRSAQVVIVPRGGDALRGIRTHVSDLSSEDGTARVESRHVVLETVGYVRLSAKAGSPFASGWYPDPVLELTQPFDIVEPRRLQPLLFTVRIPPETPPGLLRGQLTITPETGAAVRIPIEIRVSSARAAPAPRLPHLLGIGEQGDDRDPTFWPKYRLNPHYSGLGNIYHAPNKGRAVEIVAAKEAVERGMNRFNLFRISGSFTDRYTPSDEAMERRLDRLEALYPDDYCRELVTLGLADKAVFYGFDEYWIDGKGSEDRRHRLTTMFKGLKERFGKYGIKTATTAQTWSSPGNLDLPVDIWIPGMSVYDEALAKVARQRGIEVWWYTIGWEIWFAPCYSRAVPWATFGVGAEGWLYYNLNGPWSKPGQRLGTDPVTGWVPFSCGSYARYGTGSLVYHGTNGAMRPSLRLVAFRDGMFDHDLLCMLRDEVERLGSSAAGLPFDARVRLARAEDLVVTKPWKDLLADMVTSPGTITPELAARARRTTRRVRRSCIELLEELGAAGPRAGD